MIFGHKVKNMVTFFLWAKHLKQRDNFRDLGIVGKIILRHTGGNSMKIWNE
jgi:hypothetical protein